MVLRRHVRRVSGQNRGAGCRNGSGIGIWAAFNFLGCNSVPSESLEDRGRLYLSSALSVRLSLVNTSSLLIIIILFMR